MKSNYVKSFEDFKLNEAKKELAVVDKNKKKIAIDTLKKSDKGADLLGGMTKKEARKYLDEIGYDYSKLDEGLKSDIDIDIDEILDAYLEAAIFTEENSDDNKDEDVDWNIYNFTDSARKRSKRDIEKFISKIGISKVTKAISEIGIKQFGHDIWYSRNGHGTGFFDRDYSYSEELQNAARKLGEVNLIVNGDKLDLF
jgi:hypothetical protein